MDAAKKSVKDTGQFPHEKELCVPWMFILLGLEICPFTYETLHICNQWIVKLLESLWRDAVFKETVIFGFPGGSVAKNPPASAGDAGSIPRLGKSAGDGNGNPL